MNMIITIDRIYAIVYEYDNYHW